MFEAKLEAEEGGQGEGMDRTLMGGRGRGKDSLAGMSMKIMRPQDAEELVDFHGLTALLPAPPRIETHKYSPIQTPYGQLRIGCTALSHPHFGVLSNKERLLSATFRKQDALAPFDFSGSPGHIPLRSSDAMHERIAPEAIIRKDLVVAVNPSRRPIRTQVRLLGTPADMVGSGTIIGSGGSLAARSLSRAAPPAPMRKRRFRGLAETISTTAELHGSSDTIIVSGGSLRSMPGSLLRIPNPIRSLSSCQPNKAHHSISSSVGTIFESAGSLMARVKDVLKEGPTGGPC